MVAASAAELSPTATEFATKAHREINVMADASPTWGKWVTHFDSVGQASAMSITFNEPSNTIASILFDRMVLSLQGNDQYKLAGSIGLAGHFPLVLPDEFPLAGYLLIVRGIVSKSHNASAILTASIGEKAFAQEWPTTGKVVEVGGGRKPEPQIDLQEMPFDLTCFTGDQHLAVGQPPKFPPAPPLTLSIGMHARRRSVEGSIEMHVESLDISMLR
jgi:hypothetical protein